MSTTFYILLLDYIAAAILGVMVIELILSVTYQRRWFDLPNARKVHDLPVPRLGGVSFLPVIMITIAVTIGMMYHQGVTGVFEQDYYVYRRNRRRPGDRQLQDEVPVPVHRFLHRGPGRPLDQGLLRLVRHPCLAGSGRNAPVGAADHLYHQFHQFH